MKIHALGIDLGKTVFHLVGLDASGQVVVRKRSSPGYYRRSDSLPPGMRLPATIVALRRSP